MAGQHLATYLNDHLAGSVVALELLGHLEGDHAGTPVAAFADGLRAEIADDRRALEDLMARLGVAASRPRQAVAWLSEKMTELKLRIDDRSAGALRRLEICDALSVGIEGKRLLWRALGAAAAGDPGLAGTDYAHLERRADDQRARVEAVRLDAAREAFGADAPAGPAPRAGAD